MKTNAILRFIELKGDMELFFLSVVIGLTKFKYGKTTNG